VKGPPLKTISSIGGLHHMLGLPNHMLLAAAGDSIESLPSSDATNKFGASFETPSGRKLVSNSKHYINNLSVCIFFVHFNSVFMMF
jgi:queuine tRNA-ribosyltransferase accessory subunit